MRRNKRRSGRGRVYGSIIVVVGLAAAGAWMFLGRGYLHLRQAQAKPAGAGQVAGGAGPLVTAGTDGEDAHRAKPPVPTLDRLAGRDEPLRPRTGPGGKDAGGSGPGNPPSTGSPAEAAGNPNVVGGSGDAGPPRPGALRPVAPATGDEQSAGEKSAADKPSAGRPGAGKPGDGDQFPTGNAKIDAALKLLGDGKIVEARHELNALLAQGLPQNEQSEVRRQLAKLADDSIFSHRTLSDDPLASAYTVQSGDRLISISRDYRIPADVLMYINGIKDATKIRAEQKLKVLRGPFNVKISKSQFRMDVYLQDLYVRSYRVGLGADQGTPEGVWKVKERLEHPTYYPPASSDKKRIIPPDDPENPLGNFWIGLEGVSGDAVGHTGYGMHGTIDPDSIGRAVSLGCVRLLNEDVEFLYKLMLPGESTVTVLP